MNFKYRTDLVIFENKKIYCHRVYGAAYVFYVSPEVFRQACESGLIDKNPEGSSSKQISLDDVGNMRGEEAIRRLRYALEHSALDYLKQELNIIHKMPPQASFDYMKKDSRLATVTLGIHNFETHMEVYPASEEAFMFKLLENAVAEGYSAVLEFLCDYCERFYMNSKNLIEKVGEFNPEYPYFSPPDSQYRLVFRD